MTLRSTEDSVTCEYLSVGVSVCVYVCVSLCVCVCV